MIWLIKVFVEVIVTAVAGGVTLVFVVVGGVLALVLDGIWWAWDLSLGKAFTGAFPHPSIDKGPTPITTWVIDGVTKPFRKLWKYFWGDDGETN